MSSHISGMKPHTSWINIVVILGASVASFLFGFCNNAIAGTLAQPSFNAQFLSTPDAASRISGMLGSFLGGGFIGAIAQWPISSRWGRRSCTTVAAVVVLLSSALLAGSVNLEMFLIFRITCGIGAGMLIANTPVYMSEVAPPHTRGILGSAQGVFVNTAYTISSLTAFGIHFIQRDYDWRMQYVIQSFIAIVLIVVTYLIPESPRWLTEKGRYDEAWEVLRRLHTTKYDPDARLAHAEFTQIKAQIIAEKDLPSGWVYIFSNPSMRKRAFCTILTWLMGQSTGVTTIANIAPLLFKSLGYGVVLQLGLSAVWCAVCQTGTIMATQFIERLGRVKSMVLGAYICGAIILIEALLQHQYLGTTNTAGLNAATAMYFLFIFFFGLTIEDAGYLYVVEIWPTHLRSEGAVLGFVSFFSSIIAYSSPSSLALETIGWKYFILFAVMAPFLGTVMLFTFPETAGLTLEEIGAKFGDKVEVGIDEADVPVGRPDMEKSAVVRHEEL